MALSRPPFLPAGFATSSSSVASGPGRKTFTLDTVTNTVPDGFVVEAVAGSDVETWMSGIVRVQGSTVELLVGAAAGRDFSALTGTITTAAASASVVGSGTLFLSELVVGQSIAISGVAGETTHEILSITDDTTLTVTAVWGTTNASKSFYRAATFSDWRLHVCDRAPPALPLTVQAGLQVTAAGTVITINPGSTRDFRNVINITLDSYTTKNIATVFAAGLAGGGYTQKHQTGTITSAALAVTGTGTFFGVAFDERFTLPLYDGGYILDYLNQYYGSTNYVGHPINYPSIITAGGITTTTPTVASDTALTTAAALGVTNATFDRGGFCDAHYVACLILCDADGTVDVCFSPFVGGTDGDPDLPTGYTYYRVIAHITVAGGVVTAIDQPLFDFSRKLTAGANIALTPNAATGGLAIAATASVVAASQAEEEATSSLTVFTSPGRQHFHPGMPKAIFTATITLTAVAGAATSWDTTAETCLWNTPHGLVTGTTIQLVTNAPGGTTNLTCYLVNVVDTTHFSLHLTLADANAGTNKVNITSSTLTTIRKWVFSNVSPGASGYGLSSVSPITAVAATTTIQLVANLSSTLSSAVAIADLNAKNLFDVAGPAAQLLWFQGMPTTITTTTITFSNITCPGSSIGIWGSQATNAFVVAIRVWGDL